MAVFNTSYNFNQGNMNFGQALLYGAFGSLTGGMGMGGSIFSMFGGGMGGYGCGFGGFGGFGGLGGFGGFGGFGMGGFGSGYCSDSMIGGQIGNMLAGVLTGCVFSAISDSKGKAKKVSTASKIQTVKIDAKEYLKTLGLTSLERFEPSLKASDYQVIKDLDKDVTTANAGYEKAKGKLDKDFPNGQPLQTQDKYSDIEKKAIDEYNREHPQATKEEKDKAAKEAKAKATEVYKNDLKEYNKQDEALKAEEKKLNDAKKAKEAKEAEVKAAIKALKDLKDDYNDLTAQKKQEDLNARINKYDGNSATRTKKSKLKERIEKSDDWKNDISEDDVKGALAAYKLAETDDEKDYWHDILVKMRKAKPQINENLQKILDDNFSS